MPSKDFEKLDTFLDNTIEGILIIEDGFIRNVNQTIVDILQYSSKQELIGNLATGILIPNINEKYVNYNKSKFQEISLLSKNADIIPAIIKVKDLEKYDKKYKLAYILDLTDLKEKETLLLEQSRMAAMGEMISMIAHQWRQPLSAISAVSSTLKLRISLNKFNANNFDTKLSEIDKYISYMSKTIDDFRNFFKKNKEKELIGLEKVVDMTLNLVQKAFENNNIIIVNNNEQNLGKIYIFKNELLQVILNILNNSKDAFLEKKIEDAKVSINYKEDKNFQYLIFEDNAGGIKEEIINKVFDPYFSTKKEQNGTGLGLYMCKTIVEKHCNGKIKAKNIKDGVNFTISIKK